MDLYAALGIGEGSDIAIVVTYDWQRDGACKKEAFTNPDEALRRIGQLESTEVQVFWHDAWTDKAGWDWTDAEFGESELISRIGVWLGNITLDEVREVEMEQAEIVGGSTR